MKKIKTFFLLLLFFMPFICSQEAQATPRTDFRCLVEASFLGACTGMIVGGATFIVRLTRGGVSTKIDNSWYFLRMAEAGIVGLIVFVVVWLPVFLLMIDEMPEKRLAYIKTVLDKIHEEKELINNADLYTQIIAKYHKSSWPFVDACDFLSKLLDMVKRAQKKNESNLKDLETSNESYHQEIYTQNKTFAQVLDKLVEQISHRITSIYDHPSYRSQRQDKETKMYWWII